jgi:ParB-like chromosome segregation protein Spo0J
MLRTIPRVAVGGSIAVIRWPLENALRLAGGGDGMELALDRAEAGIRGLAGHALADDFLVDDAARRRAAADERERVLRLRSEAIDHAETARERVAHGTRQAASTRARAAEAEERQRQEARERSESEKAQAAKATRRRKAAAARTSERLEEDIDDASKLERLETLDTKAEALRKKEEALTAQDEAARLKAAASGVKAKRRDQRS